METPYAVTMTPYKPQSHPAVAPYLLVRSVAAQLDFLTATFGAVELVRKLRPDGSIRHAEVRIDDTVVMMGERPADDAGRCSSIHVYVPDVDATHRAALAAGGRSTAAPADQDYGDRTAGIEDPEGNLWWIGTLLMRPD